MLIMNLMFNYAMQIYANDPHDSQNHQNTLVNLQVTLIIPSKLSFDKFTYT